MTPTSKVIKSISKMIFCFVSLNPRHTLFAYYFTLIGEWHTSYLNGPLNVSEIAETRKKKVRSEKGANFFFLHPLKFELEQSLGSFLNFTIRFLQRRRIFSSLVSSSMFHWKLSVCEDFPNFSGLFG